MNTNFESKDNKVNDNRQLKVVKDYNRKNCNIQLNAI